MMYTYLTHTIIYRLSSSGLAMIPFIFIFISSFLLASAVDPNCHVTDHGYNLRVFHINSPCSPLKSKAGISWEDSVLQMQTKDQNRLQYLSSLVVTKKTSVPIASGRQIIQSPTYIVRVQIGTPPQPMLLAMDTSNDAAWIPCTGCVGCSSSTVFDSSKSTTFKTVSCQDTQCRQVWIVEYNYSIGRNTLYLNHIITKTVCTI